MGNWDDFKPDVRNERLLSQALDLLCEIHSRKMSDEARRHWMRRLLPLCGSALFKAMELACDSREHFSLAWIMETAAGQNRRDTKPYEPMPEPTEEEKKKADQAAILSLLWLHYANGWELERVGAETISRLVAKQIGKPVEDIPRMLAAAKEIYGRDLVLAWMQDQERVGR